MVAAIREAGGHVRYIEAENEGHGFELPLNLLYVAAAAMDFLAECLALERSWPDGRGRVRRRTLVSSRGSRSACR